jgi:glycerol-3-phosphate O-acyltransferase / dihydroxyacetone phosphate acyltransferase
MSKIATLRLSEMILRQKGTLTRRAVHAVISIALRLYFRRIQTSGAEEVPKREPLIFVLNHPNGLIDPGLVFCALPRRVSFLAKSTLFQVPVAGWLLSVVEALPLYRRIDQGEDLRRNLLTFAACHDFLQQGRCIALFPEGISHGAPHLLPLKTGAARIALGALAGEPNQTEQLEQLKIVPVGLYYTTHTPFRSEALLQFGPPIEVKRVELDADGEPPRAQVNRLTQELEAALRQVTLNFADEEERALIRRSEQIFSSALPTLSLGRSLMDEFLALRALLERRRHRLSAAPEQLTNAEARLQDYIKALAKLGVAAGRLSISALPRRQVLAHFLRKGALLLLLFSIAWLGMMIHAPAYLGCELLARRFRQHGPDEGGATVKILAAIGLMPLTWLLVAAAIWVSFNWRLGVAAFPAIALCGYVGLRWLEDFYDLQEWVRAALLLLNRRVYFLRLLRERRALSQAFIDQPTNGKH